MVEAQYIMDGYMGPWRRAGPEMRVFVSNCTRSELSSGQDRGHGGSMLLPSLNSSRRNGS